jgi:hypothetical protein
MAFVRQCDWFDHMDALPDVGAAFEGVADEPGRLIIAPNGVVFDSDGEPMLSVPDELARAVWAAVAEAAEAEAAERRRERRP